MTRLLTSLVATVVAAIALAFAAPAAAAGDREVRVTGTCTGSSKARLRLRADDGAIRVELRIESRRPGLRWRVVVLHERRLAFRGTRATGALRSLELRRAVPDWFGTDEVVVRATSSGRELCRASATL